MGRSSSAVTPHRRAYLGTYTGAGSRGVYVTRLDTRSGRLEEPHLAAEVENPSFLVLNAAGDRLYAVTEIEVFEGRRTGLVNAFAVDRATGDLAFINRQLSEGASPCHLAVAPSGRHLLVANYHGGSVAVLPIRADGGLDPAACVVQHEGRSVHPERQEAAHAHSVYFDAAGRLLALDLGMDQIRCYALAAAGRLEPADPPYLATTPGAGPRHLAFDFANGLAFVANELDSTVTAYGYDVSGERVEPRQTVSTLPAGFVGPNTTAEIQLLQPDGFLYVSNRGHDSIAVFAVGEPSAPLHAVGHVPTGGHTPRHFAIAPDRTHLVVANQGSDDVRVFEIDAGTGRLQPTGSVVGLSRPVCVAFAR